MNTVAEHSHSFPQSEWPFSEPTNTMAFTTNRVLQDGYPILLVTHDQDGDWQFMCTTTNDSADGLIVCLGCAYQRDNTVGEVADLPNGWQAWRDYVGGPWVRVLREPDPGEG
jgi:hypothetical protein